MRTDGNYIDELLGAGDWSIEPAQGAGSVGQSWIATDGDRRLFVKQGVNVGLLRALAELDVTPEVVAGSGDIVVQQFVEGVSPGTGWIDEHVDEVGTLIKRYRDAAALHELVRPLCRADYVAELSNRLELTASEVLRGALQSIAKETFDAEAEPTVTHGDLNTSNFILRPDGRLCLVDWDDARASDPMRDLGPLLWWYVRPTRWRTAVMAAGHPFDPLTHDRIFWWAASRSIDVALWLVEHGEYERAARFAEDADAAARGLSNPRGWWVT